MGLFDTLLSQADDLAGKVGITPDQVQSIASSIQSKIGDGSEQMAAVEQVAQEHGLPVEKVQELLGHAGSAGDVESELSGLASGFFNKA
jgi:hypothetical protein